ncbi:ABC transporter ATP-binding protein [Simiaoa sp.]|uniref:ABC transporter ATP-binding protein n=1 Tax=Simiaoa sp. TaxID=2944202 RepID=UPI003F7E2E68
MKELKRYFSYIGKYKVAYWTVFVFTLVSSAVLTFAYPYMNKLIFNALEYRDIKIFWRALALCIVLVILNCLAPYRRYFQIKIVRKIVFDIKIRLFEKLLKLDMEYYEKNHSGDALKTLNWDANSLKDSYFSHVFWVFGRLVNGITSIMAMFIYSPLLMLVSVGFCFITVFSSVRINKQIKEMDKGIQKKISHLTTRLSDILFGFTELKMYKGATIVCDYFYEENGNLLKDERIRASRAGRLEMITFFLGILASFGTIGVGAYLVSCGRMDYGTVMAIVSLQMGVCTMIQGFGSALTTLSASLVKAGRVFDFLEMDCEEGRTEGTLSLLKDTTPIEIDRLTFSYDGEKRILNDFSLCIKKGEKVILMGESGCGKSTLIKLLLGFYQKINGSVKLYGRELKEYSLIQLRQIITYVPQRNYLFEGTIRENIMIGGIGREPITEDEIVHAAKMAYADEFIRTLPQGYDTPLVAGGNNLSVGQKQRIAIARAFLKDSPILLLDEPSSALDVHSGKMISQALRELMKDKVVIMVSHKRDGFDTFDRVINM